jgi:hypothetical protein
MALADRTRVRNFRGGHALLVQQMSIPAQTIELESIPPLACAVTR